MAAVKSHFTEKETETQRGYMARTRSGIQSQVWLIPKSSSFLFPKLSPEYILAKFYHHSFTSEFLFRTHSYKKSQNLVLSTTNILFPSFEEFFILLMLYAIQHYENRNVCIYVDF